MTALRARVAALDPIRVDVILALVVIIELELQSSLGRGISDLARLVTWSRASCTPRRSRSAAAPRALPSCFARRSRRSRRRSTASCGRGRSAGPPVT